MPDGHPVPFLRWADAESLGASVAVTTRHGGVSEPPYDTLNLGLHVGDRPADVAANRARAASAFGTGLDRAVFAHQVHGAGVSVVGADEGGRGTSDDDALADTDVLVTTSRPSRS